MTRERRRQITGLSDGPDTRYWSDVTDAEREETRANIASLTAAIDSAEQSGQGVDSEKVLGFMNSSYVQDIFDSVLGDTGIDLESMLLNVASSGKKTAAVPATGGWKSWLAGIMEIAKPAVDKGHRAIMKKYFHKDVPADEPCPVWWRLIALLEGKSIITPS